MIEDDTGSDKLQSGENKNKNQTTIIPTTSTTNALWEKSINHISIEAPRLASFLRFGVLLSIKDDIITLGYPKKHRFQFNEVQRKSNLDIIKKIIKKIFDAEKKINFILLENEEKSAQKDLPEEVIKVKNIATEIFKGDIVEIKKEEV